MSAICVSSRTNGMLLAAGRALGLVVKVIRLQGKKQENPYFTLNYQENKGFPGFFELFFSVGFLVPSPCSWTLKAFFGSK